MGIGRTRTYFVTTKTSMGRALLQSERNATLFIDVVRCYVAAGKFKAHDFVVMPDHVHLLITVDEHMSIERARTARLKPCPDTGLLLAMRTNDIASSGYEMAK
jgi:REP element-mobilizing transposase RayT